MKKQILAIATTALLIASTSSIAGDAAAGKAKAGMCAACHGATGVSANPMWPNLAGQKEMYLSKQIKAFKSGSRKDPMMAGIVAGLNDADIANLSAYYAGL
jgi:cytochrome c553